METKIGTFAVKSGTLMVSDPCYGKGTRCHGQLRNVANGTWEATTTHKGVPGWGRRVALLTAHRSGVSDDGPWHLAAFRVGVDSGQAGIWDLPAYGWGEGECDDKATFYGKACAGTDAEDGASVMDGGVVSRSGYGDGSYKCSYQIGAKGKIVAVRVEFIGDNESEDE